MPLALPDETRQEMVDAIKGYFLDEREEEIGDLQASVFLEFVLKEIGPSIYNQAIKDAQARLHRVVAELDITLHETEFAYTAERRTRRNKSTRAPD